MQNDDSKHSSVPIELETTPEIRKVIVNASKHAGLLMSAFEANRLGRASLAASLLWEYIIRMDWRYHDLLLAGEELSAIANNEGKTIRTSQLKLVDRTEAFHRQIYGTLSVLILFLSHSAPRRVVSHLPIFSVQKFLRYLLEQPELISYSKHFNQLLSSVKYRASLLDHPQQSKLHHWMTMGIPTETVIIHYVPTYVQPIDIGSSTAPIADVQYLNPRKPNFRPIIECSSFEVSPDPLKTQVSMCSTVVCVLEWCAGANDKEPDTT